MERLPDSRTLRLGRAQYQTNHLNSLQNWTGALLEATKGLEISENDVCLLLGRAHALLQLRRWQEALADYSTVLSLNPNQLQSLEAEAGLSQAHVHAGNWKEAAAELMRQTLQSASIRNSSPICADLRSLFCAQLLISEFAAADYQATRLIAQIPEAGDREWANKLVRISVARSPLCTPATQGRLLTEANHTGPDRSPLLTAAVHYRLGHLTEAEALLGAPHNEPLFLSLAAMLLADKGQPEKARVYLQSADAWFAAQKAREPDSAIPADQDWREWAVRWTVWQEATRKLAANRSD